MKHFYLAAISLLSFLFSFSAPVITAVRTANWNVPGTWDLNRVPAAGDSIVIPANKKVTVDDIEFLGNVYLKIKGTLEFKNAYSMLSLGSASTIVVNTGGKIDGKVPGLEFILIGLNTVFTGIDIAGPRIASFLTGNAFAFLNEPLPLPVKFISFDAALKSGDVRINWSTAEEINADYYEVERSFDGAGWDMIAYVAAAGTTSSRMDYFYTDKKLSRSAYYRIKEVDKSGSFTYTSVVAVKMETAAAAAVAISAAQSKVVLRFPQAINAIVSVRLVSMNGQVMSRQTLNQPSGQVSISTSLKGNYVVVVTDGKEFQAASQVIL
jgi:hypothetical protein